MITVSLDFHPDGHRPREIVLPEDWWNRSEENRRDFLMAAMDKLINDCTERIYGVLGYPAADFYSLTQGFGPEDGLGIDHDER